MNQKEVKICGKDVTLCYCYATEIGYKAITDEYIENFITEARTALEEKRNPDIKRTISFLLAGITAFYESTGKESPVTDTMLMTEMTPDELATAYGTLLGLRSNFYHLPAGEPTDKPSEQDGEKNV
jgi:hypothetical protein